jgi:predicted nucleotidyltransferase
MMFVRDRHLFESFAARIRERFPSAQIWAFGSRARGDATKESDFDIYVVTEGLKHEDRHTIRRKGGPSGGSCSLGLAFPS